MYAHYTKKHIAHTVRIYLLQPRVQLHKDDVTHLEVIIAQCLGVVF